MTKLENPIFMTAEEMNAKYDGKYLLVKQPDRSKIFEEGEVIAWGSTEDDFNALADMLGMEQSNYGFLYPAHIDKGEDIHVVFGEIKHEDSLSVYL